MEGGPGCPRHDDGGGGGGGRGGEVRARWRMNAARWNAHTDGRHRTHHGGQLSVYSIGATTAMLYAISRPTMQVATTTITVMDLGDGGRSWTYMVAAAPVPKPA